jgi:pimeloyl-ACP methyl ester carboxylesterase
MLLIHGAAATGTEWLAVLPELRQHFTVCVMERRGRAPSGDGPAYSIDREVEDVAAMVAAIGEPVVLVGHSYGALIVVQGMKANGGLKNVAHVILYEPPVFANRNPDHATTLKEAKAALAADDRDRVTELFLGTVFGKERAHAVRSSPAWPGLVSTGNTLPREMETSGGFEGRAAALRDELKTWNVPTTMLVGSESPAWMKEGTEFICSSAPACRSVTLEGQSHMANVQAPALFVAKVLNAAR